MNTGVRFFVRDESGSITIEYVLWVPVLMFWLVISVLTYGGYQSRNAAANAAYAVADVMSRQVEVDEAFLDDLLTLQINLLKGGSPYTTLRVTSVRRTDDGDEFEAEWEDYQILWSHGVGVEALKPERLPVAALPEIAESDTVILVQTQVAYHFFADWLGDEWAVWQHDLAVRPRYVAAVAKLG